MLFLLEKWYDLGGYMMIRVGCWGIRFKSMDFCDYLCLLEKSRFICSWWCSRWTSWFFAVWSGKEKKEKFLVFIINAAEISDAFDIVQTFYCKKLGFETDTYQWRKCPLLKLGQKETLRTNKNRTHGLRLKEIKLIK